jgi:carboxyl-terminal processing protease
VVKIAQKKSPNETKTEKRGRGRAILNVAILLVVLGLGVGIGNGSLMFSNNNVSSNKSLPKNLDYNDVEELYDTLREKYDGKLTVQQLQDGLKSGLIEASGDPYTEYFSAEDAKDFNDQISGTFSGIGAKLGKDDQGNIVVMSPISGFPAEKAGLRAKDIIVSINGESTSGFTTDKAVSKIRGKSGTVVKLLVLRGENERKEFSITREEIKVPSVEYEILPGNIGYLQITQFSDDTADLTRKAAESFKAASVNSVVLDMRGNPGGLLSSAVEISELWLPSGKTILQEKRDGKLQKTYTSSSANPLLNGVSTIVLIDEGSASASEIVAGALKDNGAATLLGAKSYGKGSVQEVVCLDKKLLNDQGYEGATAGSCQGAEVKITVARWFRPNGQNIDKKGIKPDVEVKMPEDAFAKGQDPQKDAALQKLKQ